MASLEHWPSRAPLFSQEDVKNLLNLVSSSETTEVNVDSVTRNSEIFPIKLPIETVKCSYLRSNGIPVTVLNTNINSVYPILHEASLPLFLSFLRHKKRHGSNVERKFYRYYTVEKLVDRFLKKRAVLFCGRYDHFMLLDGLDDFGGWETVGQNDEEPPRVLKNCLSYDEIKLSALLSVSSYTCFINNGARDNCGEYRRNIDEIEDSGIIIGLIGARFTRPGAMEYQDIIVDKEQNTQGKGYGSSVVPSLQGVFSNFYGEPSLTYVELKHELKNTKKYHALANERYFNNNVYAKRMALSFDTLLIEANERARDCKTMAYVYVVGIGLGVWRISSHQNDLFMDIFCKRIEFLGSNLQNVSDICFSYVNSASCGKYKHGDTMPISDHPNGGINIHIIRGNPHTKLSGKDQGKLLVVSYAWDGNALPGNEFWIGQLASSSDPAAACSTQIAELHNPHINSKVSAAHLKIATLNGVESFSEYVKKIKESSKSQYCKLY